MKLLLRLRLGSPSGGESLFARADIVRLEDLHLDLRDTGIPESVPRLGSQLQTPAQASRIGLFRVP